MGISDKIEAFINELMRDEDDWLELKRNELASVFNCVPSQINYVISTRFSRDRGYIVESRRGGGGYMRIRRISTQATIVDDLIDLIGNSLDCDDVVSYVSQLMSLNIINEKEARLIMGATSGDVLPSSKQGDELRASIMKGMLSTII